MPANIINQHAKNFFSGVIIWEAQRNVTLTVPWSFDAGYDSALFQTDPALQLGVRADLSFQNKSVTFGVDNLLSIGGNVTERPCLDQLFRDFHCGTGLPWTDKPNPSTADTQTYHITYRVAF